MKALLASLFLSLSTMTIASEIVTDSKDIVLASFKYTRQGQVTVSKSNGQFEVLAKTKIISIENDESLKKGYLSLVEQDLEKSAILEDRQTKGPISTLFHNRLNLAAAIDLIETSAVRMSISDLAKLNEASSNLKYKIKIAHYKSNDDENCKALRSSCSGSYTIETIIDIVK